MSFERENERSERDVGCSQYSAQWPSPSRSFEIDLSETSGAVNTQDNVQRHPDCFEIDQSQRHRVQ